MSKFGANIPRDRKIYGNCQVFSPEGKLMFRCDNKKAKWYLDRELAYIVNDEPLTIQLNFKPNGLGNHNKPFGLNEMTNQCVNCGSEEFLTRHHVVPYCYRKYFPIELKSHNFHDVLSLCMDCHDSYERKADHLKSYLSKKYNAPINGITFENKGLVKAIKNANILLRDTSTIPQERIEEIKSYLKEYLNKEFDTNDLLELSASKKALLEKTHGQIVMEKISDIQKFIFMWRKHFIENNECKYLPENWQITNKI